MKKISVLAWAVVRELVMRMIVDSGERKKLLREGKQYLEYMKKRKQVKM